MTKNSLPSVPVDLAVKGVCPKLRNEVLFFRTSPCASIFIWQRNEALSGGGACRARVTQLVSTGDGIQARSLTWEPTSKRGETAQTYGRNRCVLNSLPCHLGAVGSGKSLHPDPSTSPEVVRGLFSNFPALVLRIQGHHALPHSLKLGAAMRLSLANKWKCASLPAGSFSSWLVTVRGCSFCPRPEGRTQTLQNRASRGPGMSMHKGKDK